VTVFDAEIELYKWFNENHSFEITRDFGKIILVSDRPEDDKAAILVALREFENSGIALPETWENKKYWVLKTAFEAVPQNVSINSSAALAIANLINNFCEVTGDISDKCDPKSINERDLINLISICSFAVTEHNKDNNVLE